MSLVGPNVHVLDVFVEACEGRIQMNAWSGDFGGDTNRRRKIGAARGDDQGCVEEAMPLVLRHPWSSPLASLFFFFFYLLQNFA